MGKDFQIRASQHRERERQADFLAKHCLQEQRLRNCDFNRDSVAPSPAQPGLKLPISLEWVRKKSSSQISCMRGMKFMSSLWLSMDYRAMASPPPPRLQHCLHCSFYKILMTLKMVLWVLITLENISKQEYHLLKQKPVSQPLLLSFCYPICYDCHNKLSDCHNKWSKFRMLFCLAFVWNTFKHILVAEHN